MVRQRPGVLTAAGIMCIIYGAMEGMSAILEIAMQSIGGGLFGQGGAAAQQMLEEKVPGYNLVTWLNLASQVVEIGVILVAGSGLLKMKPWSRPLTVGILTWIMVRTLAYTAFFLIRIAPLMGDVFQQELARQGLKKGPGPDLGGLMAGLTGFCVGFGAFFWIVYLAVVLFLLFKPNATRALAEGGIPVEPLRRDYDNEPPPRDDYEEGWDVRRPADQPPDDRIK